MTRPATAPMRRVRWLPACLLLMAAAMLVAPRPAAAQTMEHARYLFLFAENLEHASDLPGSPVRFDGEAWYGGSSKRLWFKLDADASTQASEGEFELQALYSRLISPFWDVQLGARLDRAWGDGGQQRGHLVLGLQGLAPYWFEVESAVFLSTDGDVSLAASAAYDLLFTQRLILESEVSLAATLQDRPTWHEAAGFTKGELGFRVRYEVQREFAPYVGYMRTASLAGTAALARLAGRPTNEGTLVAGLRMWY